MEGRLEIYYNGVWGTVCDSNFSGAAARVVCASLGFGRTGRIIRNTYGQGNGNTVFDSVSCNGDELSIADCSHSRWGSENTCYYGDVAISCRNSPVFVRLVDPNNATTNNDTKEGRLEIYYNGVWGAVCDYRFSDAAARVVCASLGFGRIGRFIRNSYGTGNRNLLFDYVSCYGNEQSITDCALSRWPPNNDCYNQDVAISCSNSPIFMRLLNPNSKTTNNDTTEGRLEFNYNGAWGTVCDNSVGDATARVVCASLGFGRAGRFILDPYGPGNGDILLDYIYCNGSEQSVYDCTHAKWGSESNCYSGDIAISCSNSSIFVRLFDPNSTTTNNDTKEGRLEIYYNGKWGTVCDLAFTDAAARIVCASLGFGRTGRFILNTYGRGNRTILLEYISCNGNELSIIDCSNSRWYSDNCGSEEVAISCNNNPVFVRLFDPNSNSSTNKTLEGRLEIYSNGVWGTVCAGGFNDYGALVVCASLGFGRTGRTIPNSYGYDNGYIMFDYIYCNGNEQRIADCYHPRWGSNNYCSDGYVAINCNSTGNATNSPLSGTTPFITTSKDNTPLAITTRKSGTVLIDTSKVVTGDVNTFGPTHSKATVTAVKVASRELSTTYGVNSVSTTLKSTTIELTCKTLPCVNGTCFTDNKSPSCACIKGYRGRLCEEDIAECDSDPCQHESKCIDGLNTYQCQCLGGYTGTNCETEVNECESNPCPNNSTCVDSINRYQCLCPNPDKFIGIHCNIAVPSPEQSDSPEIVETSPKYGPMSGGTRITITGRNLDKYGGIFFVYIGNIKLPIKNWTSSWSEFSVVTPAGDSSLNFVSRSQRLTFEITGGKNISSNLTFTYQPDPEIEDVTPTEHLASGGTTLTILGNHLNSSASPFLRVIINTTKPGYHNKNISMINGPKCDATSSNEIYCLMPAVNIEGYTVLNQPVKGRRRRREDNAQNTTTYLTLALISDGAQDSPNETIEFVAYKGVLYPVTGPVYFNPGDDPFIHIKGRDLNIGIGVDDYEIFVGTGICTNITLTAYELSCRPPTEEPEPGSDQAIYCSATGGLPVIVFVGRKVDDGDRIKLIWACLIYPSSKFSWWIVGVICGVFGLLLAFGLVCLVIICIRRRSKRLPRASKQPAFSARYQAGYNFGPAKPDWTDFRLMRKGN